MFTRKNAKNLDKKSYLLVFFETEYSNDIMLHAGATARVVTQELTGYGGIVCFLFPCLDLVKITNCQFSDKIPPVKLDIYLTNS